MNVQYRSDSIWWYYAETPFTFRENGPCEIDNSGEVYFAQHTHKFYTRTKGPAVINPSGMIQYRQNIHVGGFHRPDGPAVVWPDGRKEYYVNNQKLPVEEFFLKYGAI